MKKEILFKIIAMIFAMAFFLTGAFSVSEGVLPSPAEIPGIGMPSLGEALHRCPDSETHNDDGSITELYTGVSEEDYNTFSVYLSQMKAESGGCTEEDGMLTAEIRLKGAYIVFYFDRRAGEAMVIYPGGTFDAWLLQMRQKGLLPDMPEVNISAGRYEEGIKLVLTSGQGFDIYYTFDDRAVLPDGGNKAYPEGIELAEGIFHLRAVCVNGELVSNELKGTYEVIMPSPQAPRASLAPGTYKTSRQVSLQPGPDDEKDTGINIYYTIDGLDPDSDSPVFNGDPVMLPNGPVTLKAVAVNRYGKQSDLLESRYIIDADPKPQAPFAPEDTIDNLVISVSCESPKT